MYECEGGYHNVGGDVNCSTCSGDGNWTAVNIQCM